jgi:hypothetical protein
MAVFVWDESCATENFNVAVVTPEGGVNFAEVARTKTVSAVGRVFQMVVVVHPEPDMVTVNERGRNPPEYAAIGLAMQNRTLYA